MRAIALDHGTFKVLAWKRRTKWRRNASKLLCKEWKIFPEKTVDEFWRKPRKLQRNIEYCYVDIPYIPETTLKHTTMDKNVDMSSWSNISNTKDCVWPHFQTLDTGQDILHEYSAFKWMSRFQGISISNSASSKRENIKFFSIPEENDKDTEEVLWLGTSARLPWPRSVKIQRVHRVNRERYVSGPRLIIATRLLCYKIVEEGRTLARTGYEMFCHFRY